jgi:hypothetical protein
MIGKKQISFNIKPETPLSTKENYTYKSELYNANTSGFKHHAISLNANGKAEICEPYIADAINILGISLFDFEGDGLIEIARSGYIKLETTYNVNDTIVVKAGGILDNIPYSEPTNLVNDAYIRIGRMITDTIMKIDIYYHGWL